MGIDEGAQVDIEVSKDQRGTTVILRTHIPDEDAWLYTEENLEGVARARKEIAEGKLYRMSEADLRNMREVADHEWQTSTRRFASIRSSWSPSGTSG